MIMARAVLRTFPFLGGGVFGAAEAVWPKEWSDSALVLFRVILLPWLSAVQTAHSERLRELAKNHLAADAAGKVGVFQAHRANLAADLAVRAAYAVHADEKIRARAAARLALASLEEWYGFCAPALLRDLDETQRGDVSHLRALTLLHDPLSEWMSERWNESWNKLCAGLEARPGGQDWRTVWLDWFEAIDRGTPPWGMPREDSDGILLDAMFWPQAEWDRGPEHINRRLAQVIAERRQPVRVPAESRDFFISYSNTDENAAKEINTVVQGIGLSTFVQFQDMGVGSNFVREMQRGLDSSSRFIALYSPAYEQSAQCQAEWSAAYNADPAGARRKILPFLLHPTQLNALARQIVYRSLVGMTTDERRRAVLEAISQQPQMAKAETVAKLASTASPGVRLTEDAKLDVTPGRMSSRVASAPELRKLPRRQRELARTILGELSGNTPRLLRSCLQKYEKHLRGSEQDLIIGVLDDHWQCARALLEGDDRIEFDTGLTKAIETFDRNHSLLVTHYPLWSEREAIMAATPIDEDAASGRTLTEPTLRVQQAAEAFTAAGQATRAFAEISHDIRDTADALAYQPPASARSQDGQITQKQRFVLSTVGFYHQILTALDGRSPVLATSESGELRDAAQQGLDAMTNLFRESTAQA
jgi:hypothetical protein